MVTICNGSTSITPLRRHRPQIARELAKRVVTAEIRTVCRYGCTFAGDDEMLLGRSSQTPAAGKRWDFNRSNRRWANIEDTEDWAFREHTDDDSML